MDVNQFMMALNSMPEKTKKIIYSSMLSTMLGLKNVENEMFEVKDIPISTEQSISQNMSLSQLFVENINNHKIKEYKDKFYQILKLADEISEKNNAGSYMSNNQAYADTELFKLLNESHNHKKENDILIIENKVHMINQFENAMLNEKPIYESSNIKIDRLNKETNYKIETICDKVIIENRNNKIQFVLEDFNEMDITMYGNLVNGIKSVFIYQKYEWVRYYITKNNFPPKEINGNTHIELYYSK